MKTEIQPTLFDLPPLPGARAARTPREKETVTYSSVSTFQQCRRRYRLRYLEGLSPVEKPHALRFGTVAHQWLEVWHRTGAIEEAQRIIDTAYVDRSTEPNEKRDWHYQTAMLKAYVEQYPTEDFEVVALEKQFSGPLVNPATGRQSRSFIVQGKVDGIVRRGDEFLLMESKTAGSLTGDYIERLAMDLQILLYSHYVRETLDYPVTSVLYNVLVKPRLIQAAGETEEQYEARKAELAARSKSGKSSAKRRMPESDEDFQHRLADWFAAEPRFSRIDLLLDFASIQNIRQQIWDVGKELLDARRTGRWHQNPRACFGFGRCVFWPICSAMGSADMVVENFFRREAPHSELDDGNENVF